MSDGHFPDALGAIRSHPLLSKHESDILTCRGCIAFGMLFHGLSSRYRVDFGIGNSGKNIAVPFAACDTPKLRAEYSHPDMCILYTCLSYFNDGLTKPQFKDAVLALQTLGPSAQHKVYDFWIESVRDGIDPKDLDKYDSILKVDLENSSQFEKMYMAMNTSMEVVSFWMNNFVFEFETYQFPDRRVTSAWNLVDCGRAIGFSGTDDNRFLLPFGIQQVPPKQAKLMATNGSMLDRIIKCTNELFLLSDDESMPFWKQLLTTCTSIGVHALIDVGGLMAGVLSRIAAEFISTIGSQDFRGVVYFDTVANAWYVYERANKRHISLKLSSFQAVECFVYFDQSRCRGSNLQLDPKACALVTLEPLLTKDKFMQGCARMRMLRPDGQSLILAGTSEVLAPDSTVIDVLHRIVSNTIDINRKGIIEWLERGFDYDRFPQPIPLDVSLESLYGKQIAEYESLTSFAQEMVSHAHLTDRSQEMVRHISHIGNDINVLVTNLSEECEREIESEEMKEKEEELEIPDELPYSEEKWSFADAFVNAEPLFRKNFIKLKGWLSKKKLGNNVATIHWSDDLYCTSNFLQTIRSNRSPESYLRLLDAFLLYPDGRVVLVSEYEADQLLPHWWDLPARNTRRSSSESNGAELHHLSLANEKTVLGNARAQVPMEVLTSMKLFRGYVDFSLKERRQLERHFQGLNSRPLIRKILTMRGRLRFLERSDLDIFSSDSDDQALVASS